MDNSSVEKYVSDIFGYCVKRLNNIEDARDLSQEIMLEILKGIRKNSIDNLDAWVWKIAHNRYYRYINKSKLITVSFDDSSIIETLTDDSDFFKNKTEERLEEERVVFDAVHSITQSHRDILTDYYISGLTYRQIAQKHSLAVNTVKTRLFYGKQKLKERWKSKMEDKKIYNRINWFVCGNGNNNPGQYLNRQFVRAIATACYKKALTIEEISLATGIPCMYIEDEISFLEHGEIIKEVNGKYITNIIIHSENFRKKAEDILKGLSPDIAKKTADILEKYDEKIRSIGFIGNDKPNSSLWWFLIPVVLREACEEARRINSKVERVNYPPRKDGGTGWIFADVIENENPQYFSGCNGYFRDKSMLTYYWSSKYFNREISNYLRRLEDVPGLKNNAEIDNIDEVLLAQGLKYNIIEKSDNGYRWSICVFTNDQIKNLDDLKVDIAKPLSRDLLEAVNKIYELYLCETPKHLHDQIKGVFGAELNIIIAMICQHMEDCGKLEKSKDEYFSKQIILTVRS